MVAGADDKKAAFIEYTCSKDEAQAALGEEALGEAAPASAAEEVAGSCREWSSWEGVGVRIQGGGGGG